MSAVIAHSMMICGSHFSRSGLGKIGRDGAGRALTVRTA